MGNFPKEHTFSQEAHKEKEEVAGFLSRSFLFMFPCLLAPAQEVGDPKLAACPGWHKNKLAFSLLPLPLSPSL